jgi:type II secretory pathway pseudopilin PulG
MHKLTATSRRPRKFRAPRKVRDFRHFRGRGMTFTEMLLSMVLVAAVLGGLQVVSASLRAESADEQTRRTLRALRAAAVLHLRLEHNGDVSADAVAALRGGLTADVLKVLLANPRTASLLASLRVDHAADGSLIVRDGYGRPIRYLPPAATDDDTNVRTTTPGDFVSAGPDGRFGAPAGNDPAAADNLYGSDMETQP